MSRPEKHQIWTRIAYLTELAAKTPVELRQVTNIIRGANPHYERFVTVKPTELHTIQKKLPSDVVLLEHVPLESAMTIFNVTNRDTKVRNVAVSRRRVEDLIGISRAEIRLAQQKGGAAVGWDCRSNLARRLRDSLTALYGYLIAPVLQDLGNANAVVVFRYWSR